MGASEPRKGNSWVHKKSLVLRWLPWGVQCEACPWYQALGSPRYLEAARPSHDRATVPPCP